MKKTFDHKIERLPLIATLALVSCVVVFPAQAGRAETMHENAESAMQTLSKDIPVNSTARAEVAEKMPLQAETEPTGPLTLRDALELALMRNPELTAFSHEVSATEGLVRQAGALPNPELELEAGEFGGSRDRKGYDNAETTVRLSQSVELGGKRRKRQQVAQSEARLAGWDFEAKRLDVIALTKQAFVDVLLAQEQVALADALLVLTEQASQATTERVKAGKVSLLEQTKANVEVAVAQIARDRATRELDTVRKRLSAAWGRTLPTFKEAEGDLSVVGDVPSMERLSALLAEAPDGARWNAEMALANDATALAKAARIPDVNISVGISRFEEDGSYAGIVGVSLPLPLFDRNAGGILAEEHRAARTEYERHAARVGVTMALAEAHNRLESARAEALAITTAVLPGAEQAFEATQTGYREGKFGQLELLDTQRTFGEVKARLLEVLATYHKAAADVERLTGVPLTSKL